LFSLTKSMSKGWQISNKNLHFVLSKNRYLIIFDHVIKTANGHVTGIELFPVQNVAQAHIEKKPCWMLMNFTRQWDIYTGML
jgi:hypothetical protein